MCHCLSFPIVCHSPWSVIPQCLLFPIFCHSPLSIIPQFLSFPIVCHSPIVSHHTLSGIPHRSLSFNIIYHQCLSFPVVCHPSLALISSCSQFPIVYDSPLSVIAHCLSLPIVWHWPNSAYYNGLKYILILNKYVTLNQCLLNSPSTALTYRATINNCLVYFLLIVNSLTLILLLCSPDPLPFLTIPNKTLPLQRPLLTIGTMLSQSVTNQSECLPSDHCLSHYPIIQVLANQKVYYVCIS